jgi:uncharacterized protein YdeI (YjbR/CyaY-like superfamily)
MLSALKDYTSLAFFKGSLLKDEKKLLVAPGPNSQASRLFRLTNVDQVSALQKDIENYVKEAIKLEKAGAQVDFSAKNELEYPEELLQKMSEDEVFKKAFEALTPGRRRGYTLYFSDARQSKTRKARIEKYISKIMEGKGWNER